MQAGLEWALRRASGVGGWALERMVSCRRSNQLDVLGALPEQEVLRDDTGGPAGASCWRPCGQAAEGPDSR